MSVYKTLNSQDIIVSPFEVNKSFTFLDGDALLSANIGRYLGINNNTDPYYNSIKQLYYSNYISGSDGNVSNASTASISSDGLMYGSTYNTLYQNYLATDLNSERLLPSNMNDIIGIMSIPKELYGDHIQPNSLYIVTENGNYIDDGEGVLWLNLDEDGRGYAGNVIYEHGIIIITEGYIYDFISSYDIQTSFSSSYILHETQYKCTLLENEFNYSLNKSINSDSDGKIYDHFTGSYFAPYITTIGLYNEQQELMAVGKLSQPLPTSRTTDMSILLNLDIL